MSPRGNQRSYLSKRANSEILSQDELSYLNRGLIHGVVLKMILTPPRRREGATRRATGFCAVVLQLGLSASVRVFEELQCEC